MAIALPHFSNHFEIHRHGPVVVEQDTSEDIAACVYRICVCTEGFREDQPEFGISEPVFTTVPLELEGLVGSIERWEPRAELEVSEQAEAASQALRQIGIEVS